MRSQAGLSEYQQHVRDIAVLFEHGASTFLVPSKAQRGNQGGGHDFCIVHLTLTVFLMMYGFQQIVTQAIRRYNLLVHGLPPLWGVVSDHRGSNSQPIDFEGTEILPVFTAKIENTEKSST